jgi:hypothetical protein
LTLFFEKVYVTAIFRGCVFSLNKKILMPPPNDDAVSVLETALETAEIEEPILSKNKQKKLLKKKKFEETRGEFRAKKRVHLPI